MVSSAYAFDSNSRGDRPRSGSFSIADRARSETATSTADAGALTEEEARSLGKVSSSVYMAYIKKLGGWCFFGIIFALFILTMVSCAFGRAVLPRHAGRLIRGRHRLPRCATRAQ